MTSRLQFKGQGGISACLLFVLTFTTVAPVLAAGRYVATSLTPLSSTTSTSQPTAINDVGQVTGIAVTSQNELAVVWVGGPTGAATRLGAPNVLSSYAYGINNLGQVVGCTSFTSSPSTQVAVLWRNLTNTPLNSLGGANSCARSINSLEQIAGWSSYTISGIPTHAVLWNGTTPTDLGTLGGSTSKALAINDASLAVGLSNTSGDAAQHAVLWSSGTMIDLGTLGGTNSEATSINSKGVIVGSSDTAGNQTQHAVLWSNGIPTDLGVPPGCTSSYASAINDSGQVVGSSLCPGNSSDYHATLWQNGQIIDLNSVTLPALEPGAFATGINNNGWIIVESPAVPGAFLLTPIEPNGFTPVINATTDTLYISNTIALSGLTRTSNPVSIKNGQYSLNGASYTSAPGVASNGDTISVQLLSAISGSASHERSAVLFVGTETEVFNVTIAP